MTDTTDELGFLDSFQTVGDLVRLDSALSNLRVGLGDPSRDKLAATTVNVAPRRLGYLAKEALFNTDAFCRAVCETVPEKAVSGGWEITLGKETKNADKILTDLRNYDRRIAETDEAGQQDLEGEIISSTEQLFQIAQTWANVKDGAIILLNIDDGQPPYEPVRRDKIKSIANAEILDRTEVRPVVESTWNPLHPKYYELLLPDMQQPSARDRYLGATQTPTGTNAYYVHRSRIIRFDGVLTTRSWMFANDGWGGSPLDLLWSEYNRWKVTQESIANALQDFSLFVHSIKGLSRTLASKDKEAETALKLRLQLMKDLTSVLGGTAIDADGEKLEYLNRQFSGISDLTKDFRDSLIGASGLPHTLLFGESPSGLGATGESEENSIANLVKEFQENIWKPKLMRLYRLIFLAKDGPTGGKEPEGWGIRFNSLIPESESDKATARQTQAQTDNIYLSNQVVTKEEVRNSRFGGEDYSFETNLDEAEWKKQQEEAAQQSDPFAAFGGSDQQALPGSDQQPVDMGQAQLQQQTQQDSRFDSGRFADQDLYAQVARETQARFKLPDSAYAGIWMDSRYRELFKQRYGSDRGLYRGDRLPPQLKTVKTKPLYEVGASTSNVATATKNSAFPDAAAYQQANVETKVKFKTSQKSSAARAFLKQRYRELTRKKK